MKAVPSAVRSFWEHLPRRRDRDLVEKLVATAYSQLLVAAALHIGHAAGHVTD